MAFDTETHPQRLAPGHRPGERLIGREVYVFNADSLNAHIADITVEDAPADLTGLTYEELCTLVAAYLNRSRRVRDAETMAFGSRVCAERASRAEYQSAFGARVSA